MRQPRFKLIVVFVIVTAVALPLGWLQYRRLALKRELGKLEGEGCVVTCQDNGLWISAPQLKVTMHRSRDGQFSIGAKNVSSKEASDRIYEIHDQLRKLAVADKTIRLVTSDGNTGKETEVTMYVDDHETPRMTF